MKKCQMLGESTSLVHATTSTCLITGTLRLVLIVSSVPWLNRHGFFCFWGSYDDDDLDRWYWYRYWLIYSLELWSICGRRPLARTSFGGLKESGQLLFVLCGIFRSYTEQFWQISERELTLIVQCKYYLLEVMLCYQIPFCDGLYSRSFFPPSEFVYNL